MKKIALIRLDKIGDLVSTLPADQVSFLQDYHVTWVIAKGLGFIPKNAKPTRRFIELDKNHPKRSFWVLVNFLKQLQPDIAVSFQAPWWVSLALWWAKVPSRAGVRSQWHSFIFLNKSLRQKRSEARQHEADYNTDLLAYACGELEKRQMNHKTTQGGGFLSPVLSLTSEPIDLSKWNLQNKKFIVVHPGMAGSALNWPVEKYIDLISFLVKENKVVLTGTPSDEPWLGPIKKAYADHSQVVCLQDQVSSTELLPLLAAAQAVVAPSTGIAHLAAGLSTPVISLFSPIQVQQSRRWAPRGEDVYILSPVVSCPAVFKCLGEKCSAYFCMDRISVDQVLQQIKKIQMERSL